MSQPSIIESKHGISQAVEKPQNAVVLERYDSRFRDYEGKGFLLFMRTATIATGDVTINMEIRPGAEVYVFPLVPLTVDTSNNVTFAADEFHNGTTLADGETIMVAVLAKQADVKSAGQAH